MVSIFDNDKRKIMSAKTFASIFFGYSSTVGKESLNQTAKRKLLQCTNSVIIFLVIVKTKGVMGGKKEEMKMEENRML